MSIINTAFLPNQRMLNVQIREAIVEQKWTNYIGDILLDTMRTDVLDYLDSLRRMEAARSFRPFTGNDRAY